MKVENLETHPEGGRFKEVFRSGRIVHTPEGKERSALTHIYFELTEGEVSRFHRVASDEVWNLYEGEGVLLYIWNDKEEELEIVELSAAKQEFCHVVRAGLWQAAKPLGGRVLVGCSVGPGFEFEDFELINPDDSVAERISSAYSELTSFIFRK